MRGFSEQQELLLLNTIQKLTQKIGGVEEETGEPIVGWVIDDLPVFLEEFSKVYKKVLKQTSDYED